jgi:hypothetical protein
VSLPTLRSSDFAADYRGFGSEIELLPKPWIGAETHLTTPSGSCGQSPRARPPMFRRGVRLPPARRSDEPLKRLSPAPARARARPVVGRQPTIAPAPLEHRRQHALTSPPRLDRTGLARLSVRVRAGLGVARSRVRAAIAPHAKQRALPCRRPSRDWLGPCRAAASDSKHRRRRQVQPSSVMIMPDASSPHRGRYRLGWGPARARR